MDIDGVLILNIRDAKFNILEVLQEIHGYNRNQALNIYTEALTRYDPMIDDIVRTLNAELSVNIRLGMKLVYDIASIPKVWHVMTDNERRRYIDNAFRDDTPRKKIAHDCLTSEKIIDDFIIANALYFLDGVITDMKAETKKTKKE